MNMNETQTGKTIQNVCFKPLLQDLPHQIEEIHENSVRKAVSKTTFEEGSSKAVTKNFKYNIILIILFNEPLRFS